MHKTAPAPGTRIITDKSPTEPPWTYTLQPADTLPVLDLSVSLKSQYLSEPWLDRVDRWINHRRLILVGFVLSVTLTPVSMAVARRPGRVLAALAAVLGLPAPLAGIVVLRYDVVRLLTSTFDVWFFSFMTTSTLGTLGAMLADARAAILVTIGICFLPNILIDANLRAVRRVATMNAMAVIVTPMILVAVGLGVIDGADNFALLRYQSHVLSADAYVVNGLMTVTALLIRNVLRKRRTFVERSNPRVIHCASYRCLLRLAALPPESDDHDDRWASNRHSSRVVSQLPATQGMRYIRRAHRDPIHAPRTLALDPRALWTHRRWLRVVSRLLGGGALAVGLVCPFVDASSVLTTTPTHTEGPYSLFTPTPLLELTVVGASLVFCGASLALGQRDLLGALVWSFDFGYMSTQATIAHVCICDLFAWPRRFALLALASWLWFHWVLCLDALTPPVRVLLGIPQRAGALAGTLIVCASAAVVVLLIFDDATSTAFRDRILWAPVVLGRPVQVRVLPLFYNCLATLVVWSLRLLWRLWTADGATLGVIDGHVAYDNYLSRSRRRQRSRRPGEDGGGSSGVFPAV